MTNTTSTTGRIEFPERGHRAAGPEECAAFEDAALAWFTDIERTGRYAMWLGDGDTGPHRVTFGRLMSGPWARTRIDYATALEWDSDTFRMVLDTGQVLRLFACDDDAAADLSWPCIYTRGREECEHTMCREEHTRSTVALDYDAIVERHGEPCSRCAERSFMRCADDECDAIVCESCDALGVTMCPACDSVTVCGATWLPRTVCDCGSHGLDD